MLFESLEVGIDLRSAACQAGIYTRFGKQDVALFNNAHDTCYLWLYGNGHMVNDHSDSEIGNLLLPHWLLF